MLGCFVPWWNRGLNFKRAASRLGHRTYNAVDLLSRLSNLRLPQEILPHNPTDRYMLHSHRHTHKMTSKLSKEMIYITQATSCRCKGKEEEKKSMFPIISRLVHGRNVNTSLNATDGTQRRKQAEWLLLMIPLSPVPQFPHSQRE